MEERVRSGPYSGGVMKSRKSSGCLIVRKKGVGSSGLVSSGPRNVYESKKEKKRQRFLRSDSGSSDELLFDASYRRAGGPRANQMVNGSIDKSVVEEAGYGSRKNKIEHFKRNIGGGDELGIVRKRSKLDVFEFDEYDRLNNDDIINESPDSDEIEVSRRRYMSSRSGGRRERTDYKVDSGRHNAFGRRKLASLDSSGSFSSERNGDTDYFHNKRFKFKRDEPLLRDSLDRDNYVVSRDEPIRVQGKNGVLKVMVNKKNKVVGPMKSYGHHKVDADVRESTKGKSLACSSSFSEMNILEKSTPSFRRDKNLTSSHKSLPTKKTKVRDWGSEDSDTPLKPGRKNLKARTSMKKVKSGEEEATLAPEKLSPARYKEGKGKRGAGTEKQLLREQIRKMLVSAGWTIDYRPRRNRDYLDAVYINPTGTAYWSIIKAYDALQKQLEDENCELKPSKQCLPFAPIAEDVLSKLTRQTRKKMEKEMKKKHKGDTYNVSAGRNSASAKTTSESNESGDNEDKLSSFIRHNSKSMKGRLRDGDCTNGYDPTSVIYKTLTKEGKAKPRLVVGRKSRKIGRCTLLVRSSNKGQNSEPDGFVPYTGKRTLLSWMIDLGTVQLSEKVQYMNRRRSRVMLEGWVTRDGIHCGCCSKILTVSKFEIHAGSKLRQPFQNIFLESGDSLLQCQLEAWKKQGESERSGFHYVDIDGDDPNDDTCGLCGDGGDLICCDGCPSTFHLSCLHIEMLPPGEWHCANCSCKFCGVNDENFSEGSDSNVGPLLKCSLCEKKYHDLCILKRSTDVLATSSTLSTSFCGQKCQEIYERLQKLLGVKHELEGGYSCSLIHRTDPDPDTSTRGFAQRVECNSKLAIAHHIMDECFLPVVDRRSGINLIHNVLYNFGSNFSRLDYSGFYTAILERGDEIISAASIRIHGTRLAEMPYIGTRHIYRRQGMCRRLFCAIESALRSLEVEKLIIPAISDLMHTWTVVFGFKPLEESLKQELRSLNMLVFPDTDMLQKPLLEQDLTGERITAITGVKGGCNSPALALISDTRSSMDRELHSCDVAAVHHMDDVNDNNAHADSNELVKLGASNDNSVMSTSGSPHELKRQFSNEQHVCSTSQHVENVAESADKKCNSSFHDNSVLEMRKPSTDSTAEGTSQSSVENEARCIPENNSEAACLGGFVAEDSVEDASGGTDLNLPDSTVNSMDERAEQSKEINDIIVSASCSADESGGSKVAVQVSDATNLEESVPLARATENIGKGTDQIVHTELTSISLGTLQLHEINPNGLKDQVCSDRNLCFTSELDEKMAESAPGGKAGDNVIEMDVPVLDANVEGTCQHPANHEEFDTPEGEESVPHACATESIGKGTDQIVHTELTSISFGEGTLQTHEINPNGLKDQVCSDRNLCFTSELAEKMAESAPGDKAGDNVIEMDVPVLDANVEGTCQPPATHEEFDTPEGEESVPHACATESIGKGTDQIVHTELTSISFGEGTLQTHEINPNGLKDQVCSDRNLCFTSELAEKMAESAPGDNVIEMDVPVLDANVEGTCQPLANHEELDAVEGNVEAAVEHDSLDRISAEVCCQNLPEEKLHHAATVSVPSADESARHLCDLNQDIIVVSATCSADGCTLENNSHQGNASEMDDRSHVAIEASDAECCEKSRSPACPETTVVDANQIARHDATSHMEGSVEQHKEKYQYSVSVSAIVESGSIVRSDPDSHDHDEPKMESEILVAVQASDAPHCEENIELACGASSATDACGASSATDACEVKT